MHECDWNGARIILIVQQTKKKDLSGKYCDNDLFFTLTTIFALTHIPHSL